MLYEIGDKPKSFVGTCEWIGAFEVSYIIGKMTGFECKIVHVSSGKDILNFTEEFKRHFLEEGTPVMFGGGVKAFTLLGIDVAVEDE